MKGSPLNFSILESFFRIHFARNEDILEDLFPKMEKIDINQPLPGSIKTILQDSGPSIYLFNRILKNQHHHYQPTDLSIQSRSVELDELYDILCNAKDELKDELSFQSLVAAIVAFHKNETNYPQIFDFILTLTNNAQLSKKLLKLLQEKALHFSVPYVAADDSSDEDFSFDEVSDVDVDLQPRLRIEESPSDIIRNVGSKGQNALFMFLGDIISRDDLLLVEPSLEHSNLTADPVAISSRNYVTQSIKTGAPKPSYDTFDKVHFSYRNSSPQMSPKPFTGATISEEFALNRNYVSEFQFMKSEESYQPALNVDNDMSLIQIFRGCQILHDQEIDIDIFYKLAVEISTEHIHTGMVFPLSQIYGVQSDEILDFLKSMPIESKNVVLETVLKTLAKQEGYYYHLNNEAFLLMTQECVRSFPHSEFLIESVEYLRTIPDTEDIADYIENLVNQELLSMINVEHEIINFDVLILTKFSKYYKYFIRKFHSDCYIKPPIQLADASTDWSIEYENIIKETVNDDGYGGYDEETVKLETPVLNKHLQESVETLIQIPLIGPRSLTEELTRIVSTSDIDQILTMHIINPHSYK